MRPSAIVLAAGEGRRMGGPKALLLAHGVPLLLLHLRRLAEVGCERIVVVVRPEVQGRVEAMLRDEPEAAHVRLISGETASQAESLALGAQALLKEDAADLVPVVVTPLDLLPPAVATLQVLLAAVEGEALAATPVIRGKGGHPVVLRAPLLRASTTTSPALSLRDVLARAGPDRLRIEVADAGVLGDLDTPADLHAALGCPPRFAGHEPDGSATTIRNA